MHNMYSSLCREQEVWKESSGCIDTAKDLQQATVVACLFFSYQEDDNICFVEFDGEIGIGSRYTYRRKI
jgi:hypothetical protein